MKKILIDSIGLLDLLVWVLVFIFFCGNALISGGNLQYSFIGAAGIIMEMVLIGMAIELIIECLKSTKGIGTITGFITNGPEAICLLVGLIAGDIIFAASTPLGSNFMNPVLLFVAALVCRQLLSVLKTSPLYSVPAICGTAALASLFFFLEPDHYLYWILAATAFSVTLFFLRPEEKEEEEQEEHYVNPKIWLVPAAIILTIAGYFLDSVVTFSAEHSNAPKGVIGFLVLATLTSWPEFKSCLALIGRNKFQASILNITVSNITNIWLAVIGVATYLVLQ